MDIESGSKENFDRLVTQRQFTLVYFFSPTNDDYLKTISRLTEINKVIGRKVKIIKVNFYQNIRIAAKFQIIMPPQLILLKDGIELKRFITDTNQENILNFIK